AQGAEAGQGDGRAGQLLAAGLVVARGVGDTGNLAGVAPQVAGLGVAQYRHHQAVVALGGDADMHRAVAGDDLGLVVVGGIDLREVAQGDDHGAHQERQQGQLAAAVAMLGVELLAQGLEGSDVDLFDIAEVGDATLGVLHALGDLAAQADHRYLLAVGALAVAARRLAGAALRLADEGVEVFMQDAPGRAAAMHVAQLDPGVQEAAINSIGRVDGSGGGNDGAAIAIVVGAGKTGPDYTRLLERYLGTKQGQPDQPFKVYDQELQAWLRERFGFTGDNAASGDYFAALPAEQQRIFARQVYFSELREGGREYNDVNGPRTGSYVRGRQAIATLFPERDVAGNPISYGGSATFYGGAGIHTDFGGGIQVLTPGGQQVFGIEGEAPPSTAGVITQGSGDIQLYSHGSILLGQSRIMTTFGGSILGWSAQGDINAGRGSKTTVVYTPPKRTYDLWGNVGLAPSVPSTGAGIATLNPIAEVPPGDIDLIAPQGTIDAGEAGIRVSGNVNIAALQVVNAANIQVQGDAKGMPAVASVNTGAIASASAAASSASQAAEEAGRQQQAASRQRQPSVITVQVLGFGGERLVPGQDGASLNPQYNRQSPVQVLGAGALDERAKAQLTEEERGNLLL
ncbi:MAG: filamentous hemagglutinin family protein, partial [Pseudomonas sp.]|nr:filamentous hemagglutinin family protein [Pseudomonas sp.]